MVEGLAQGAIATERTTPSKTISGRGLFVVAGYGAAAAVFSKARFLHLLLGIAKIFGVDELAQHLRDNSWIGGLHLLQDVFEQRIGVRAMLLRRERRIEYVALLKSLYQDGLSASTRKSPSSEKFSKFRISQLTVLDHLGCIGLRRTWLD